MACDAKAISMTAIRANYPVSLHTDRVGMQVQYCLSPTSLPMSVLPSSSVARGGVPMQYRPRSYQLEMLEESLKANIIVTVLNSFYYVY